MKKLMFIMGTRPEVIKLAPVVFCAQNLSDHFQTIVVSTSQHREMLDQMLETFQLKLDYDLNLMKPNQDIGGFASLALQKLNDLMHEAKPDLVIVQGDTSTTLMGALAAHYHHIPVAHIEAGLRTNDKKQPFPEEMNRRLTGQIADYHFAPTEKARENLLREGIPAETIWVTGNTGIDALFLTLEGFPRSLAQGKKRNLLVTTHRRENLEGPMRAICHALVELLEKNPDLSVTFPVHLSPRVRETVFSILKNHERVNLIEPLSYREFVKAMDESYLILTDSGGVQEEAPSLGKPVLVLRDKTERPEGVDLGSLRLVGTDGNRIVQETQKLLDNQLDYDQMAQARNPYGDGTASKKILEILKERV